MGTTKRLMIEGMNDDETKQNDQDMAMDIAMKYKFVTPWTSMIVVQSKEQSNKSTKKKRRQSLFQQNQLINHRQDQLHRYHSYQLIRFSLPSSSALVTKKQKKEEDLEEIILMKNATNLTVHVMKNLTHLS